MEIKEIVNKLAEIKCHQKLLKEESEKLQAVILAIAEDDLKNTKLKSISYSGDCGNKITATIADTVTNIAPTLYRGIFGKAYSDYVTEEVDYTLKTPAKRLISALWNKEYCSGSVDEIISGLKCDEKSKRSLQKKLKGVNFETDKKNLMLLGGLSEEDASDNAYLIAEIAAWNNIGCLLELNGDKLENITKNINAAVVVSQSTKLCIESGD